MRAGLLSGDFIVFVENINVTLLDRSSIKKMIQDAPSKFLMEIFRPDIHLMKIHQQRVENAFDEMDSSTGNNYQEHSGIEAEPTSADVSTQPCATVCSLSKSSVPSIKVTVDYPNIDIDDSADDFLNKFDDSFSEDESVCVKLRLDGVPDGNIHSAVAAASEDCQIAKDGMCVASGEMVESSESERRAAIAADQHTVHATDTNNALNTLEIEEMPVPFSVATSASSVMPVTSETRVENVATAKTLVEQVLVNAMAVLSGSEHNDGQADSDCQRHEQTVEQALAVSAGSQCNIATRNSAAISASDERRESFLYTFPSPPEKYQDAVDDNIVSVVPLNTSLIRDAGENRAQQRSPPNIVITSMTRKKSSLEMLECTAQYGTCDHYGRRVAEKLALFESLVNANGRVGRAGGDISAEQTHSANSSQARVGRDDCSQAHSKQSNKVGRNKIADKQHVNKLAECEDEVRCDNILIGGQAEMMSAARIETQVGETSSNGQPDKPVADSGQSPPPKPETCTETYETTLSTAVNSCTMSDKFPCIDYSTSCQQDDDLDCLIPPTWDMDRCCSPTELLHTFDSDTVPSGAGGGCSGGGSDGGADSGGVSGGGGGVCDGGSGGSCGGGGSGGGGSTENSEKTGITEKQRHSEPPTASCYYSVPAVYNHSHSPPSSHRNSSTASASTVKSCQPTAKLDDDVLTVVFAGDEVHSDSNATSSSLKEKHCHSKVVSERSVASRDKYKKEQTTCYGGNVEKDQTISAFTTSYREGGAKNGSANQIPVQRAQQPITYDVDSGLRKKRRAPDPPSQVNDTVAPSSEQIGKHNQPTVWTAENIAAYFTDKDNSNEMRLGLVHRSQTQHFARKSDGTSRRRSASNCAAAAAAADKFAPRRRKHTVCSTWAKRFVKNVTHTGHQPEGARAAVRARANSHQPPAVSCQLPAVGLSISPPTSCLNLHRHSHSDNDASIVNQYKMKIGQLLRRGGNHGGEAEPGQSAKLTFDSMLNDKRELDRFRVFAMREFAEENLNFWLAVQDFKKLSVDSSSAIVREQAQKIYDEYIDNQSPSEINIDPVTRDTIRHHLTQPVSHMFDLAQHRVHHLLESDIFPRFLQSDLYKGVSKAPKR